MICGPNLSKLSAHTLESTESSPPGWPCCSRQRPRDITGHLQQMRPGRVQPVMARQPAVGFQLAQQVKPGLRAGHHRDRDRPVEADHRARCELPEQIVEAEYLRPVSGADGLR